MEFSKTIFQAWKVMENSQSRKVMEMMMMSCLTDIDSLTASADEYAEKAEQTHQVSNSFRRSAKENSTEMTAVEEQLKQKLHEFKRVNEVVLDRLFCNTEILVNTCIYTCGFIYYDNSYDKRLEIYFYSGKHSSIVYRLYACCADRSWKFIFFGHGKVMENHC